MREPPEFAAAFRVEQADIPPELTIAQWRRQRAHKRETAHGRRVRARDRLRRLVTRTRRRDWPSAATPS